MNNTDNTVDLLKIKIERAKEKLSAETLNAIAAIDWQAAILSLREKRGYSFEQLGDLSTETELLLCGLITPAEYPKELQERMRISKAETNELIEEMNILVFKKIKEELIKNSERKKIFEEKDERINPPIPENVVMHVLEPNVITNNVDIDKPSVVLPQEIKKEVMVESREDMLKKVENPESIKIPTPPVSPILMDKLSNSLQTPIISTNHSLKPSEPATINKESSVKIDPYREVPE